MNFTNPLKFEILDRYKSEEVIVESVNEFKSRELQGELTGDDYNEFFRSLGPYLNISKTSLFDLAFRCKGRGRIYSGISCRN